MVEKLNWQEKYVLSLNDGISINGIRRLFDCGQPTAIEIRNRAVEYCRKHEIFLIGRIVPTDVVLEVTKKPRSYFFDRMVLEKKLKEA
jgi:hypothetical protein